MLSRRQFFIFLGGVLAACTPNREPDYTVTIRRDEAFEPAALTIPAGSMVAWHHMADQVHTVTADAAVAPLPEGASPFDSGDLYSGQRWVHTFDLPGTYIYFCRYHQADEMLGIITVVG
jgi:plastocyanin